MTTGVAVFLQDPKMVQDRNLTSPDLIPDLIADLIPKAQMGETYLLSVLFLREMLAHMGLPVLWVVSPDSFFVEAWEGQRLGQSESLVICAGGAGIRKHQIYERIQKTHQNALIIDYDAPYLIHECVREAMEILQGEDFVLGESETGHCALFGGRLALSSILWLSVPWGKDQAVHRLSALLPVPPVRIATPHCVRSLKDLEAIEQAMDRMRLGAFDRQETQIGFKTTT